jgi:GTP1/Obg family GTP-binding protein
MAAWQQVQKTTDKVKRQYNEMLETSDTKTSCADKNRELYSNVHSLFMATA